MPLVEKCGVANSMRSNLVQSSFQKRFTTESTVPKTGTDEATTRQIIKTALTIEDVAQLEDDWRDLERRSNESFCFFQTYEWCYNWLRKNEHSDVWSVQGCRPVIVTVFEDGQLQLVCPMMKCRLTGGVTILTVVGEPHTQYGNVLLAPVADPTPWFKALWQELGRIPDVDTIRFNAVPAKSPFASFLSAHATRVEVPNETAFMDFSSFPDWAAFQSTQGTSMRRGRAKRRNKLAREGDVTFHVLRQGDEGFTDAVIDAARMKQDWLRETGRVSLGVSWTLLAEFLAEYPRNPDPSSGIIAHAIRLDGRNIAIEVGFIRNQEYYSFLGGFDWEMNAFSPGKIQIEMSFRWFLENGIRRFDFLPNPADYKAGWTNERMAVFGFVYHNTLRGRLNEALFGAAARQKVKQIYYRIPKNFRALASSTYQVR